MTAHALRRMGQTYANPSLVEKERARRTVSRLAQSWTFQELVSVSFEIVQLHDSAHELISILEAEIRLRKRERGASLS